MSATTTKPALPPLFLPKDNPLSVYQPSSNSMKLHGWSDDSDDSSISAYPSPASTSSSLDPSDVNEDGRPRSFSTSSENSALKSHTIIRRMPVESIRQRTAQACDKCRLRKTKCNGDKPTCERCASRGFVCQYAGDTRTRGPSASRSRLRNSMSAVGPERNISDTRSSFSASNSSRSSMSLGFFPANAHTQDNAYNLQSYPRTTASFYTSDSIADPPTSHVPSVFPSIEAQRMSYTTQHPYNLSSLRKHSHIVDYSGRRYSAPGLIPTPATGTWKSEDNLMPYNLCSRRFSIPEVVSGDPGMSPVDNAETYPYRPFANSDGEARPSSFTAMPNNYINLPPLDAQSAYHHFGQPHQGHTLWESETSASSPLFDFNFTFGNPDTHTPDMVVSPTSISSPPDFSAPSTTDSRPGTTFAHPQTVTLDADTVPNIPKIHVEMPSPEAGMGMEFQYGHGDDVDFGKTPRYLVHAEVPLMYPTPIVPITMLRYRYSEERENAD